MNTYDSNYYLENKCNWYIDIPRIIANKKTRLVIGKGILLQSENEKLLNEWNEFYSKDKWFEKLSKFSIQNSLLGRCILFWMLNKNGELSLVVPTPTFMSRVAKINEQEQSAELFFTNNQADNSTVTWVTITPERVKVEIFNNMSEETVLGTTRSKNKPDLVPENTYTLKNPFNFLPIVEITNLPNPLLFGQSTTLNGYPDCMPVYPLIEDVQHTIKQKRKERVLNQTRIFGKLQNEKLLDLMMGNTDIGEYIKDAFIEVASSGYDKQGNGGIEVVQGDPKFSEYWIDYNGTKKEIYNGAGLDAEEFNGVNYENKTKSLMNNKLDMETKEYTLAHYKPYIQRMIDIWMIYNNHWNGKGERPYSFDFLPIAMTDQLQQKELLQFQLDYGLITRFESIGKLRNVNNLQAKAIVKEIDKETKEFENKFGDNEDKGEDNNGVSKQLSTQNDVKASSFSDEKKSTDN